MTPLAINIAIAKTLGWAMRPEQDHPAWACLGWREREKETKQPKWQIIPDYHGSLDAIHKAEVNLTNAQHQQFRTELRRIVGWSIRHAHSATAAERAEAYLRALSLWVEDAP